MIHFLRALAALMLLAALTVTIAHAQQDTVAFDVAHDPALPPGVLAVTACSEVTGKPIVLTKHWPPEASVMVHEAVHVEQIKRYGGCPRGLQHMARNRISLVEMEAEAYCAAAYWSAIHERTDVRTSLNLGIRGLHQAAAIRAIVKGEKWRLSLGEITKAFGEICPQIPEPQHRSIYSDDGRTPSGSGSGSAVRANSPLTKN